MIKLSYKPYVLKFKNPSGTSRGVLKEKKIWLISAYNTKDSSIVGIGECNPLVGLSIDDVPNYEDKLSCVCENFQNYKNNLYEKLINYPSIYFGIEMALIDLKNGGKRIYYNSNFVKNNKPIKINGLIWMGTKNFMEEQIKDKINKGFTCIKIKIGAINFEEELQLLKDIRKKYNKEQLEIRVDANGAFSLKNALEKLHKLSKLDIHSIEQPIKTKQTDYMSKLCKESKLPIALDEELIGVTTEIEKEQLLQKIKPQYIILKPSLIGGFRGALEWIKIAEKLGISWWITSALESNIGLNAISQFTSTFNNPLPQGLGTGQLYTNNIKTKLKLKGEWLTHK